jgi:gamma-glutamyltranspeptidase/glutathione hydrolase
MSFGEVADAAIRFARDGFAIHPYNAEQIRRNADDYREWPQNAEVYLPGGKPPEPGDLFVQTDLAKSLQYLVDEERAAAGRGRDAGLRAVHDAFYRMILRAPSSVTTVTMAGGLRPRISTRSKSVAPAVRGPSVDGSLYVRFLEPGPTLIQIEPARRQRSSCPRSEQRSLSPRPGRGGQAASPIAISITAIREPSRYLPSDCCRKPMPISGASSASDHAWPGMLRPGPVVRRCIGRRIAHADQGTWQWDKLLRWTRLTAARSIEQAMCFPFRRAIQLDTPIIPGTGLCPSRSAQGWADGTIELRCSGKRPRSRQSRMLLQDGDCFCVSTPGGDPAAAGHLQALLNMVDFGMSPQAVEAPRLCRGAFQFA